METALLSNILESWQAVIFCPFDTYAEQTDEVWHMRSNIVQKVSLDNRRSFSLVVIFITFTVINITLNTRTSRYFNLKTRDSFQSIMHITLVKLGLADDVFFSGDDYSIAGHK